MQIRLILFGSLVTSTIYVFTALSYDINIYGIHDRRLPDSQQRPQFDIATIANPYVYARYILITIMLRLLFQYVMNSDNIHLNTQIGVD